jgi:predicted amidohydrolase YtcJ
MRTELVIADGSIVDGTGAPSFEGDVAVREGRIVAVGQAASDAVGPAARVIDARGRTVTPGFIDIHTHSDIGVLQGRAPNLGAHQLIRVRLRRATSGAPSVRTAILHAWPPTSTSASAASGRSSSGAR